MLLFMCEIGLTYIEVQLLFVSSKSQRQTLALRGYYEGTNKGIKGPLANNKRRSADNKAPLAAGPCGPERAIPYCPLTVPCCPLLVT